MAELFSSGDLAAIAEGFVWPVVTYAAGHVLVDVAFEDTLRSLTLLHGAALRHGMTSTSAQIVGYEGRLDQRFSVDVMWEYLGKDGAPVAKGEIRYFCWFDPDDNVKIEMQEFRYPAFPEVIAELQQPDTRH
ncbi:MAG: hypothetical protein AAFQ79_10570 [Pseudomonadota bacterium]